MAYKNNIEELSSRSWGGLPHGEQRRTLLSLYTNLRKLVDNYLAQNERTVLRALRNDEFDDSFKKELYKEEENNKNRKRILEALE